jgi:hypothetical protein
MVFEIDAEIYVEAEKCRGAQLHTLYKKTKQLRHTNRIPGVYDRFMS